MNSVFSAFKSSGKHDGKQKSSNGKKIAQEHPNSYEKLRHIREISCNKMNNLVVLNHIETNGGPSLSCATTPVQSPSSEKSLEIELTNGTVGVDQVDRAIPVVESSPEPQQLPCTTTTTAKADTLSDSLGDSVVVNKPPSGASAVAATTAPSAAAVVATTTSNGSGIFAIPSVPPSTTIPTNNSSSSTSSNQWSILNASSRFHKPRLSLSNSVGLSGSNSNAMPSVHGRSAGSCATGGTGPSGMPQKTRLSTHQRNLSLDFRSMGILLPPVSQVTNTRINMTQHHRNRSLDSALQRIPEVEVSSPSAESENTLCNNMMPAEAKRSTLPAEAKTMCADTFSVKLSTNPTNTPTMTWDHYALDSAKVAKANRNSHAGVLHGSGAGSMLAPGTRTEKLQNEANDGGKESDSKKREDLTSLGSDDSGIICGSEPDHTSLTRIRRSRESLDSSEIDPSEEECIELLETTSMDEEYRMLQSDLCFYPQGLIASGDGQSTSSSSSGTVGAVACRDSRSAKSTDSGGSSLSSNDANISDKIRYREQNINKATLMLEKICVPIEYEDIVAPTASENGDRDDEVDAVTPIVSDSKAIVSDSEVTTPLAETKEASSTIITNSVPSTSQKSDQRNEIIFRNFLGATKNAIVRTAQSIIDNHEKKTAKNKEKEEEKVKSPTETSKKRDFSVFGSRSKSKEANSNSSSNPNGSSSINNNNNTLNVEPQQSPESEDKCLSKSSSTSSLKVPGTAVAACTTPREIIEPHIKAERGQSGLLRFFESPVFNIHHAVQYLFNSKEPGVLSFIGNKIFSFPDSEVDLYIPQLIIMYMQIEELSEVLDPYLVYRCRQSVDFSLKCIWMLEAYNFNRIPSNSGNSVREHLSLLKELYPRHERRQTLRLMEPPINAAKKTHHRSQSDATGLLGSNALASKLYPAPTKPQCHGDLSSGRAFDNGCVCFESVQGTVNDLLGHQTVCICGAPKLTPEKNFMKSLIDIGRVLSDLPTKMEKTSLLRILLNLINKNLPARVWLPLHSETPHHVVRITEKKMAVLNSKDRTPYIIYVEVVEVNDIHTSPVIPKMMPTLRHTKSEERLDCSINGTSDANSTSTTNQGIESLDSQNGSTGEASSPLNSTSRTMLGGLYNFGLTEDDVWSQEDDEITAQCLNYMNKERDSISQHSMDSYDSRDQGGNAYFNIGDVRNRCQNVSSESKKPFSSDPEDPSAAILKEPWFDKEAHIRESSPYGHLPNWKLLSAIVKCGDDLRQELMATQLLEIFKQIWDEENVGVWVRPYKIVCLSNDSGLIEPILNTVSLHQIKKNSNKSLCDYFLDEYGGDKNSQKFLEAQRNFMSSCAAYCLISYLLQVKDRHNGNILLHNDGHLIHIDFGFILSISPKNLGFEQSPFKLTPEFVDVIGGHSSELWVEFKQLLLEGLKAARKHMDRIINIVEIMRSSSQLPCFRNGYSGTVRNLRSRFHMNLTEQELERKVEQLVLESLNSVSTKLYDRYQYFTNGIL